MQYTREDMVGEFYQWDNVSAEEDSDRTPNRRAFDRYNGNQVLYIINHFVTRNNSFSKEYCQLLEKKIADDLPLDAKSELSVFNWITVSSATEVGKI